MRHEDPVDEALERLAPSFEHELPYWEDVLVRAEAAGDKRGTALPRRRFGGPSRDRRQHGTLRWRVRPLVIALAVMLGVAATGTAFALERYVFVGEPAPPAVKKEFSRLDQPPKGLFLPSPHHPPGVMTERARAAAVIDSSSGPVYLWVAPTRDGGYCEFLQIVGRELPDGRPNGGGGCIARKTDRLLASVSGSRLRDGRYLQLVRGRTPRAARRVELRFPNGSVQKVPVERRFFLAELRGADPDGTRVPRFSLVALAANGRVVGRQRFGHLRRPSFDLDVSDRRPLIEIRTRRTQRVIRLYVFESGGQRCNRVVHASGMSSGGCSRYRPGRDEIVVSPEQIGAADDPRAMLLLRGEAGPNITSIELRFDDGKREPLPLVKGWTLYQVDPADLAAGRLPTELIGRDSEGRIVARSAVGG